MPSMRGLPSTPACGGAPESDSPAPLAHPARSADCSADNHQSIVALESGAPCWADGTQPVVRGVAPADVVTIADFEGPPLDRFLEMLHPQTGGGRTTVLTAIHAALATVVRVVVQPFLVDGLLVDVHASECGFVVDARLDSLSFWVGDARFTPESDVTVAGGMVNALMQPVVGAIHRRARVARHGVEIVVIDSLSAKVRYTLRRAGRPAAEHDVNAFVDACGFWTTVAQRTLPVTLDDGPPTRMPLPRVCCVLSSTLSDGACPGCPKYPDDVARAGALTTWVAEMTDDEFFVVTGRRPIGRRVQPTGGV